MIARVRGEHDTHWGRWRPSAIGEDGTVASRQRVAAARDESGATEVDSARLRPRRVGRWLGVLAVAIVAGYLAASAAVGERSSPRLPATPRAWLDAYEAAAIDNPTRVCSELFAPQLAKAYGNTVHGTCSGYFRQITSFSVVVRRVLRDGGTAVLELRQTVRPRDWAVVLDRRGAGWQAVDLLTVDLAR